MRNTLMFILISCLLIVFTSAKPIKTNKQEAIIVGRLVVDTDSELNKDKMSIAFQNGTKGYKKAKVDTAGFFCTKIGINNSFVDYIQYKDGGDFRKIFSTDCMNFVLPEAGKVYYIGDIHVNWTPSERDKIKKGFSLGIGMGGPYMGGGVSVPISSSYTPGEDCPGITIVDYSDVVIEEYKENYPDDDRDFVIQFINLSQN